MLIAPSVLAADHTDLGRDLARVEAADWLHLDIMDGHFVPNISFGPALISALRPLSTLFFDVHLMVSHPLQYAPAFAKAGADSICFHLESEDDPAAVIAEIRRLGKLPALSIKPGTPAEAVFPFADLVHMVLIMTVEPGFGGQALMPQQLEKARVLKARFPRLLIEADGGIGRQNIRECALSGVDVAVAGTSIFKAEDPAAEIALLKALAQASAN